MDAPIFPTERRDEETFVATDLVVDAKPAVLTAGTEYRIERLTASWAWLERPVGGTGADWKMAGKLSELPAYVPADAASKIVKNKVAWHILDDSYQDKAAGTCDA